MGYVVGAAWSCCRAVRCFRYSRQPGDVVLAYLPAGVHSPVLLGETFVRAGGADAAQTVG
jgi:hypothetical protein